MLPRAESIALLRHFRHDITADDRDPDALGDLPLALHLSGSFLQLYQHDMSVADYLRPATVTSLNNLGYLLQALGQLTEARPYFERALAIQEQVLGPEHPATALSLNNLGYLLYALGDLTEARPYYERALVIATRALGPDHPHTRIYRANLAALGAPPQTRAEQIAAICAQAAEAVAQVLGGGSAEERAALAAGLEEVAQQAADGDTAGSPYLALADDLRAMAARLRLDDTPSG